MNSTEQTLSRKDIFKGRVFDVHVDDVLLQNSRRSTREVVEHNGGVAILAVDDADNIIMVRQFRYGVGESLLELPAGKLERGEDPAECGLRELREETGMEAGEYSLLARMYPTPAYCSECIYIYLARKLKPAPGGQNLDENEILEAVYIPLEKALAMCLSGEITDAKTLIGILKYAYAK
ncbi:MAG: NUDIX hydrolase [Oscillospiraceae bacterium]|nr:NUDIX hydrolase [Oscillospiraceae bacterium]